jgi:hypothetical protein
MLETRYNVLTNNKQVPTMYGTPTPKEEKTMKKETTKKVETKEVKKVDVKKVAPKTEVKKAEVKEEVKKAEPKTEKKNKEKVNGVPQMINSELAKLFNENGCATYTRAKDESKVVYNTFGTKSRVLQQNKAYQLLLTNGHKKVKEEIVDSDNDDVKRFDSWYGKLKEDDKKNVLGYDTMLSTKLDDSELPRERSVKLTSKELLVSFLKYMGTFEENKVLTATTK